MRFHFQSSLEICLISTTDTVCSVRKLQTYIFFPLNSTDVISFEEMKTEILFHFILLEICLYELQ
jgi:hypothetical protein